MPPKSTKTKLAPLATVASAIKPEKTEWIWPGWIAVGCVTVIAGYPGIGKSQILAALAANVSRGETWPCGGGSAPKGDVVMLIGEADLAKDIRPLLMAMNADLDRVHLIGENGDRKHKPINLFDHEDLNRVAREVNRTKNPKVLIIDPIGAFADSRVYNGVAARQLLANLTCGAKKCEIAIVLICHLTRSGGRNALSMIAGSSAIAAASRAVHLATNDEPGSEWRILACVKNNLAPDNVALRYRIEPKEVAGGIATTRLVWNKHALQMTADEALAKSKGNGAKPTQPRAIDELLKGLLADGKRATKEIFEKGKLSEFTEKQLRTAAARLGVVKTNTGYGQAKRWFWELPATKSSKVKQPQLVLRRK
jgi:putative DNA primase/helicase